ADFVVFENDEILERVKLLALPRKRVADLRVPRKRIGLVVAVGEHGVDCQLAGEPRNLFGCNSMKDDERAARFSQALRELFDGTMNELDTTIGGGPIWPEWIENDCVENENAVDALRGTQCLVKRRVVCDPQVAAKPHEG